MKTHQFLGLVDPHAGTRNGLANAPSAPNVSVAILLGGFGDAGGRLQERINLTEVHIKGNREAATHLAIKHALGQLLRLILGVAAAGNGARSAPHARRLVIASSGVLQGVAVLGHSHGSKGRQSQQNEFSVHSDKGGGKEGRKEGRKLWKGGKSFGKKLIKTGVEG